MICTARRAEPLLLLLVSPAAIPDECEPSTVGMVEGYEAGRESRTEDALLGRWRIKVVLGFELEEVDVWGMAVVRVEWP